MASAQPDIIGLGKRLNDRTRFHEHDNLESEVMDIIRPFTTRRHLPDRWVSIGNILCPFDVKTTVNCEDKSHYQYAQLSEVGFGMFIVYRSNGVLLANWFDDLQWAGPFKPTDNSRNHDPYFKITGGGEPLAEFVRNATQDVRRKDFIDALGLLASLPGMRET